MSERREATNVCRFVGQLYGYSLSVINGHPLGKGELRLPDPRNSQVYQPIKIIAWYVVAERLQDLQEGCWVEILSSYSPSSFRGNITEEFTVYAVSTI